MIVVDQNVIFGAVRDAVFGGNEFRIAVQQLMRERFGKCPNLLLQWAAFDRHVHVNPARARGFRITRNLQGVQSIAHDQRCFENALELGAFDRIEIELQKIGTVNIVTARVPGIQIDAAKVDHPHERSDVLYDREVDHVAGTVLDGANRNRGRAAGWGALHEEKAAIDTVGIALHDHRAVLQVGHQIRRHVEIVLEQIPFGQAELGPKNLVEVGELGGAAFHFDFRVVDAERNPAGLGFGRGGRPLAGGLARGGLGRFLSHRSGRSQGVEVAMVRDCHFTRNTCKTR